MRQRYQNYINIETLRLLWGRLGTQSGTQRGSGRPKVSRRRGQDSDFEVFGQTFDKNYTFLEMLENIRKTQAFPGFERVRAPKLEPLGLKSRAQEGSGQPK